MNKCAVFLFKIAIIHNGICRYSLGQMILLMNLFMVWVLSRQERAGDWKIDEIKLNLSVLAHFNT